MRFRILLTASVLGAALAFVAPAQADQVQRATGIAAGIVASDNIHQADWRDRRGVRRGHRRAERRAHRRWERRAERRAHRRWDRRDRRAHRRWERRAERRAHRRWERRQARRHHRGAGRHHYGRGDYIPRSRYRVINNYYDYGWRRPNHGYRYVHADGRYFLVQIATGLIIAALLY